MPISIAHLPFVALFFLMVAAPSGLSYLLLIAPASRPKGKSLWWGSFVAGLGIIVYQMAYVPVMLFGIVLFMAVNLSIYFLSGHRFDPYGGITLFLFFFVFWFFVLLWGYVSGFRVGWRIAQGLSFAESVQVDHLYRLSRWFFRWITTYKRK